MNFLVYTFINWWCFIQYLPGAWGWAILIQAFLLFNFFTSTWVRFAGVMRFKMILDTLDADVKALSYYEAYKFLVEDVLFRFTFAPFMFHELPIPKNRHDWLMTGVLHRIKSTHPVDSWQYKRADKLCSSMLDKADNEDHC
jgi:hypothetical protein